MHACVQVCTDEGMYVCKEYIYTYRQMHMDK